MITREEIQKQLDEAKTTPKTRDEISGLIDKAKTLRELNELRGLVVTIHDRDILLKWQEKYWSARRCPTCGHIKQ